MSKPFLLKRCPANPTLEYADSIIVPEGTTEIISEGGGSTIDVGKWVANKYGLPHTAIPTTGGTGSELTKYAVFTQNGKKKTFTNDAFVPTSYILNPKLSLTLPRLHTLASGLDALSQSLEAFWSKNRTQESDIYAKAGMRLVLDNLKKCLDNLDDEHARMNMLLAANMSGRAINITKTNVCHAISYPLTDIYGIPHGLACAMSLKYFAKKAIGLDLTLFFESLDIPHYEYDKEKVADIAMESEKLEDFPLPITRGDILSAI